VYGIIEGKFLLKMTGGALVVEALLREKTRYIFGIPGGQLCPIFDAVYRHRPEIDIIMTRHEQAAAHMADAWSRFTGQPGVCIGTVGPGATDLLPGVAASWADNSPVIVLTAQHKTSVIDPQKGLMQGIDQHSLYKPITKWNAVIRDWDRIPELIHWAFREATTGRPGPVQLDLPQNILYETREVHEGSLDHMLPPPEKYRPTGRVRGDHQLIKEAVKLILQAEKPLVLAGGGVIRSGAWNELRKFVEFLVLPTTTTIMGKGALPENHPCHIGHFTMASRSADVVLAIGCRFSQLTGFGQPPIWLGPPEQKIIHVDIDPGQIGKNVDVQIGIVGDAKSVLTDIQKVATEIVAKGGAASPWLKKLQKARDETSEKAKELMTDGKPIKPARLVHEIREFFDEDTIIVVDGGDMAVWGIMFCPFYQPRSFAIAIGMGHLGAGLPFANAAKLAHPDKQVVVIHGDGSFMLMNHELETAKRYGLTIIDVVGNDRSWGMIKNLQARRFEERYIGVDFTDVNLGLLAEAFGCYGERVEKPEEIQPALKRAVRSNLPAVLDVTVERVDSQRFTPLRV